MSEQLPGIQPTTTALSADDPHGIGGYRLHARLGSGGMGVVYLAYTPGGRPVALKAVRREFAADPEFRERFAQEVASARRIHGLFTAQVVDSGVDHRTPWLATAYVPGPSLHEVVRRHGPLPVRTVLLLVAGIAEALQAIHRAGVVHRDLKPANVLVAGDGPRVIDFGIARAADAALTGTGLRIGTAAFMAPEQALGLQVTPATDVFALGTLAAYVAGGATPFGNGSESTALYRIVHERPDLTHVPRDLHGLISWCLAKRPEDRPATAELIASVHAHPVVGSRPEFTDGWLPSPVRDEVGGRDGAARPAAAYLRATGAASAHPGPAAGIPAAPPAPAPAGVDSCAPTAAAAYRDPAPAAPVPAPARSAPAPAQGPVPPPTHRSPHQYRYRHPRRSPRPSPPPRCRWRPLPRGPVTVRPGTGGGACPRWPWPWSPPCWPAPEPCTTSTIPTGRGRAPTPVPPPDRRRPRPPPSCPATRTPSSPPPIPATSSI